ncbi:hypothetical protein N657DRAFT_639356 [Parathielavia appendiculata]|uniref:Uncharacterized protein n=1 Tax=Parathielavia appendiculata TaxID=2587402 RepID=A0AAN6U9B8_9PEZI|nr:hypothetical protein N657DRAFT_639356 [Parathielavia appendiculata]
MKFSDALLAIVPVGFAAAVRHQVRQGPQTVNVVLQLRKASTEASIAVQNADRSEILHYGCGTSLSSGAFQKHPIAFNVDRDGNGAGNLNIGPNSYLIHEDPEFSGGISCARLHSNTEMIVTCAVTLPASVHLEPVDQDQKNLPSCFPTSTFSLAGIFEALERDALDRPPAANITTDGLLPPHGASAGLDKRQGPCAIWTPGTRRVGDGNPHQNPFNIQLSENMQCDAQRTCAIQYGEYRSFTVGFSASAQLTQWISGGFAVEQSVQTGNKYTCDGNPGDFFCVWRKVGQTAYTVQNVLYNACTGDSPSSSPFILWSPNANNKEGWFYCVYGRQYCRSAGQGWLDTSGRAGGP